MSSNCKRDINQNAAVRLTLSLTLWVVLAGCAGYGALQGGLARIAAGSVFAGAVIPALFSVLAAFRQSHAPNILNSLTLFSWPTLACLLIMVSGGVVSPALFLLTLGPVVALALGRAPLAAEAALFGLVAVGLASLITALGLFPAPDPGLVQNAAYLSLAGIASLPGLVWAAGYRFKTARLEDQAPKAHAALRRAPRTVVAPAARGQDEIATPLTPRLDFEIDEEGRIASLSGDRSLMPDLEEGADAATVLPPALLSPPDSVEQGTQTLPLENGAVARIEITETETGQRVSLTRLGPAEAARLDAEARARLAEERLRERTVFFASLGHELKTPLNAIIGFSEMLSSKVHGDLPAGYRDYPELIHESGQDLLLLVEDLLDFSKTEAGSYRIEPEPVDLVSSGESVMRQLSAQARRAGIGLDIHAKGEVWAMADARAVRQVWQNLISNAIKYSEKGAHVILDAELSKGMAVLIVSDTGTGMSEADLERIREPFEQGENARGRAGTGLGLAVVHSFVDLLDGHVEIESVPGEGTSVRAAFPKASPADLQPLEGAAE